MQKAGILAVNKPAGKSSFSLISRARRLFGVKKIGHTGTLDPFATGVILLLVGREYTKLSFNFLSQDKEYETRIVLGKATDTYDCEGNVIATSDYIPTQKEVEDALKNFQGEVEQIPPMFSAKKQGGKKLYELARKGIEVERPPVLVKLKTHLLAYAYPYIDLRIACSKGTYIRSIGHDLGKQLGSYAYLERLARTKSGNYCLDDCIDGSLLFDDPCFDPSPFLQLCQNPLNSDS